MMYNSEKVQCWKINVDDQNAVYVTYPDGFGGHDLYICSNCGEIYAADVEAQLYQEPLNKKLEELDCKKCNRKLSETIKKYPENYIDNEGNIVPFVRNRNIPSDSTSIIKEFPSIY